jgi:hypothetical protein
MDWIDMTQDRDQWRVFMNTVMNNRFHKMLGSSSVAGRLEYFEEGLSAVELVLDSYICSDY